MVLDKKIFIMVMTTFRRIGEIVLLRKRGLRNFAIFHRNKVIIFERKN